MEDLKKALSSIKKAKKVSMKETKSKPDDYPREVSVDKPRYPYGLRLTLNKNSLKKLGKSVSDFAVKEEVPMLVMAKVASIRSSEDEYDDSQSVEMQITEIVLP